MNIVCVSGGSYKSIYLNYLIKLKKCDLLIFNFSIFYNIDKIKKIENSIVGKEIVELSKMLNCTVVVGVIINKLNYILVCKDGEILLYGNKQLCKIHVGKYDFNVCSEYMQCGVGNKIILSKKPLKLNICSFSKRKIYIFISSNNAVLVQNKKIQRKINKCSNFILN